MQDPPGLALVARTKKMVEIQFPLLPDEFLRPDGKPHRHFPSVRPPPLTQLRTELLGSLLHFGSANLRVQNHLDAGLCDQDGPGVLQSGHLLGQLSL